MIVRKGIFETNSSSTHALCIGKGKLEEPYKLIRHWLEINYDVSDDVVLLEDYFKVKNIKNIYMDDIWEDTEKIIYLRRIENIGRVFRIYGTVASKLNFIWSCLLCNSSYNGFEPYIEKFLEYLLSIPNIEVRYLDVKLLNEQNIAKHPEYKNDSWDKPHILAKYGKLYIVGLDSYGYVPTEEIKRILDDEKLFWNLILGNGSKIYTGSDETDLFEDLDLSNYKYKLVGGSDTGSCYTYNKFAYEFQNNKPDIIGEYVNGNYKTTIYEDGTRTRELQPHNAYYNQGLYKKDKYKLNEIDMMEPDFVESIDLKITNYCLNNCDFCYANSCESGEEAEYEDIIEVLDSMKPYTEIAIGGGNVLSYHRLKDVLYEAKSRHIICNITTRDIDIMHNYNYKKEFEELCEKELIYGCGVSITDINDMVNISELNTGKVQMIAHLIIGVNTIEDIKTIIYDSNFDGVLLLGYKKVGKGLDYYNEHKAEIDKNIVDIKNSDLMSIDTYKSIAFDNLAIEQLHLDVKDKYCDLYQGEDGKFSMYIDLVENKYAKNSLEENKFYFYNLEEAYQDLKENN